MTQRPGGRTAQTRAIVSQAVESLLEEKEPAAITMVEIGMRAGVAPSSLYRRWGDIRTLLTEVAMERLIREAPLPDAGALRADLKSWARTMAASLGSPQGSTFFRIAIGAAPRTPAEGARRQQIIEPRMAQIAAMLDRALARGEIAPTVHDVRDYLLAPLYMRTLFGSPVDGPTADALVDKLLDIVAQ